MPAHLTLTPQLLANAIGAIITEAVAFGILNTGTAQTIVGIAGIVIPAAFAIAQALHLGHVHAALVDRSTAAPAPAPAKPATTRAHKA